MHQKEEVKTILVGILLCFAFSSTGVYFFLMHECFPLKYGLNNEQFQIL